MTQATGSNASIAIWEETTYNTRPGSPTMFQINAATEGVSLKRTVEKLMSKAITDARGTPSTRGGNITVSGAIPFELPLLGIGKLLKHVIGTAATPAGAGTLTLTGTTLTWAAQGETAGADVDVAAGGEFTLASSVANHEPEMPWKITLRPSSSRTG